MSNVDWAKFWLFRCWLFILRVPGSICLALFSVPFFVFSFSALGFFWFLVEAIDYFFGESGWGDVIRPFWWVLVLFGSIYGLVRAFPRNSVSKKILGTDTAITVRRGNIFSSRKDLAVGAPITFDVELGPDLISPKSLQGRYTKKYFDDLSSLKAKIRKGLSQCSSHGTLTLAEKPFGNRNWYERGTAVYVDNPKRNAYFIALAQLNLHGRAHLSTDEFRDALPVMWNEIREKGEIGQLDIGLIGAGYSRLGLNKRRILTEIVASFVAATREGRWVDQLDIYITAQDFKKGNFKFDVIEKVLEHECGYYHRDELASETGGIGTALP